MVYYRIMNNTHTYIEIVVEDPKWECITSIDDFKLISLGSYQLEYIDGSTGHIEVKNLEQTTEFSRAKRFRKLSEYAKKPQKYEVVGNTKANQMSNAGELALGIDYCSKKSLFHLEVEAYVRGSLLSNKGYTRANEFIVLDQKAIDWALDALYSKLISVDHGFSKF